ncbi:MAG: hypothetical protein PHX61_12360 [Alphaproteobacteria bacterium]|nr:hypothetical protein [Alphaproteobacteria bacterium]
MEETVNNTTANAVEESVESLKKLIATIQEDSELKKSLEETLRKLTGKPEEETSADEADESAESSETEEDNTCSCFPEHTISDSISDDEIASLVIGFVAGAAVVGGGVLLHKILSK